MNFTTSKFLGLLLSLGHFVLFVVFSVKMNIGSQDAMSGILWDIWRTIDFPVSLLAFYGFIPAPLEWSFTILVKFIYPYFIHGVIGTVWWFFIPVIIGYVFNKLLGLRSTST